MNTVQLSGNTVGGLIQGNFGNYMPASDGTYTVDTRDAPSLVAAGMKYTKKSTQNYTTPIAPIAASATGALASTTLSNGTVSISSLTQPAVMRQLQLVATAVASPGPSAGSVALTYVANDSTTQTDKFSVAAVGVTPQTYVTSKGVAHVLSLVASAIAGGTSYVTIGTTSVISLPVDANAKDFAVFKEDVTGADEAVGTLSTSTLGSIAPTTAPDGTQTYSFGYAATAQLN